MCASGAVSVNMLCFCVEALINAPCINVHLFIDAYCYTQDL